MIKTRDIRNMYGKILDNQQELYDKIKELFPVGKYVYTIRGRKIVKVKVLHVAWYDKVRVLNEKTKREFYTNIDYLLTMIERNKMDNEIEKLEEFCLECMKWVKPIDDKCPNCGKEDLAYDATY